MNPNTKTTLAVIAGVVVIAGVAGGAHYLFGRGPNPGQYIGEWEQTGSITPGGDLVTLEEARENMTAVGEDPSALKPWTLVLRQDGTGDLAMQLPDVSEGLMKQQELDLTWEMHGDGISIEAGPISIRATRRGSKLVLMLGNMGNAVMERS
jgi:hypothetical protein